VRVREFSLHDRPICTVTVIRFVVVTFVPLAIPASTDTRKKTCAVFLPRDATLGLCCRPVSVCLSVTLVDCNHMVEDIVKLLVHRVVPPF